MKTAVLVATLATSANAFSTQKMQKAVKASIRTQRQALKKTPLSADVKLAAKKVDEDVEIESHGSMRNFEVVFGNTCDDPIKLTGYAMNTCMNEIDNSTATDGHVGEAYSYRFVPDYSGGPPAYEYFWGHQCRDYLGGGVMDLMSHGFPASYTVGTCQDFLDGSGNLMYRAKAYYSPHMHEPHFSYVSDHIANKPRNCERDKFMYYNFERTDSGICFDDEDEDGNVEFYKWNIANCAMGNIDREYYSDGSCSTMTHSKTYYARNCTFDSHDFFSYLEMDGYAEFGYDYNNCGMMP